jgi:hypothetical protein
VRILQLFEAAMKKKDIICLSTEWVKAFWGIDSVNAFTSMVRSHPAEWAKDIL